MDIRWHTYFWEDRVCSGLELCKSYVSMCSIRIAFLQAVSGYYRLGEGNYGDIHGKCEESDYTGEKHTASKRWYGLCRAVSGDCLLLFLPQLTPVL